MSGSVESFDVFDTTLTRRCGSPGRTLALVGRRLRADGVIGVEPEAYAAARAAAGADLTADPRHHPTLERIAGEVAARLGLPDAAIPELVSAELAVESEVCVAVPGAVDRLEQSRRRTGRGAVFVSDTSLPADFLEALLTREALFRPGDRLFVSAAAGESKQHGDLFDVVRADLGVPAGAITHVGDDRWSDVIHARERGWVAQQESRVHLSGRELALDARAAATEGIGPRLAAAARIARLRAVDEGRDATLAGIAGTVALPLLAGFGLWTLRQAELLGLDRLYFVSRDGEVFREVVEPLAAHGNANIECRYLYGSRLSWQLAATGTSGHDGTLWVPDDADAEALSAREILAVVDLEPADALELTGLELFAEPHVDAVLGADGWHRLAALLAADPLRTEIRRRARDRRDLLLDYLAQEGVTSGARVGLVDVGWTGRAARSLEDVLLDAGRPLPAVHLFLGLLDSAPDRMGPDLFGRSRGWLLDEARGRRSHTVAGEDPVMLIETFAMGSEGHTSGYVRTGGTDGTDGTVAPALAAAVNPATRRWDFAAYRAGLHDALAALVDGPALDAGVDLRPTAWAQLLDFWRAPTAAEARAWGAQPYGEDFRNDHVHPLATPAGLGRVLARLGVGGDRWRTPTYWTAGTIALSPQPWRALLGLAYRLQRHAGRLRQVRPRLRAEWLLRRPR